MSSKEGGLRRRLWALYGLPWRAAVGQDVMGQQRSAADLHLDASH